MEYLEPGTFHEAQAAGIEGDEAGTVDGVMPAVDDLPDLVTAQDEGKLLLLLGASDVEDGPLPSERLFIEELEAAQSDGMGTAGDLLDRGKMDEVVSDLLLGELVRGPALEPGQVGDCRTHPPQAD